MYNTTGSCHFSQGTLKWKNATTLSGYSNAAGAAVDSWNSASTQFNMNPVTSGANIVVANQNFGTTGNYEEVVGVTSGYCDANNVRTTSATSSWNTAYTSAYSTQKRQSIMAHELGHALGLGHYGDVSWACAYQSLMTQGVNVRYDKCGIYVPLKDDINGVNSLY